MIRLGVAWLALSLGLLASGPALFEVLLPLFKFTIDLLQPDLDATLRVARKAGDWTIEMQPLVIRSVRFADDRYLQSGTRLGWWSTDLGHNLLPLVLYLSAIVAWPVRRKVEWIGRLAVSVPVAFVLLVISAPLVLAGQLEISLIREAAQFGAAVSEPRLVTFLIFMESGGCWLLPLTAAVACIVGVRVLTQGAAQPPRPLPISAPSGPPVFPPV